MLELFNSDARKVLPIAESLEIPMNQLAIAWVLSHPEVSSTLAGASKPEHIVSNAEACELALTKKTLEQIEALLKNSPSSSYR